MDKGIVNVNQLPVQPVPHPTVGASFRLETGSQSLATHHTPLVPLVQRVSFSTVAL
jgi:hypothetical protein